MNYAIEKKNSKVYILIVSFIYNILKRTNLEIGDHISGQLDGWRESDNILCWKT